MKVRITDDSAFNSLNPELTERYLLATGWNEQHRLENGVSIWFADHFAGETYRLWLPVSLDLPDYGQIMGRAVRVLAEAEGKSELQIFEDLSTVAVGDVIRVVDHDPLNREGTTLPLSEGENLIQRAKDLTVAAAMSENQPREVHSPSRSRKVRSFEESLRLAQTEPGSYTVKIISPIILDELEVEKPKEQLDLIEHPAKPFSRKAIERLVKALDILKEIGEEVDRKGVYRFDPFKENVPYGISANLCEAIVSIGRDTQTDPVHISVTWSSALQKSDDMRPSAEIEIPSNYKGYYQAAAEEFRSKTPVPRSISGYVKVLSRERGESEGTVSIITAIDNAQAVVRVELSGEDYSKAVRAHDEELFVVVEGDLVRRGRYRWLNEPQGFQIIESPEFPF